MHFPAHFPNKGSLFQLPVDNQTYMNGYFKKTLKPKCLALCGIRTHAINHDKPSEDNALTDWATGTELGNST